MPRSASSAPSTWPITPEQLFEVLSDAESWPQWASVITNVAWTSPQPYDIGTTRTVTMRGGIIGHEEFLAWEPYSHMAFRFNDASTTSIAAFAEDYWIVPTDRRLPPDLGDGDEAERHRRAAGHVSGKTVDGVDVPAVPEQPAPIHRQALRPLVHAVPGRRAGSHRDPRP